MVGSDQVKGTEAEQTLNTAAVGGGRATFVRADLASLQGVRALAATITERIDHLGDPPAA